MSRGASSRTASIPGQSLDTVEAVLSVTHCHVCCLLFPALRLLRRSFVPSFTAVLLATVWRLSVVDQHSGNALLLALRGPKVSVTIPQQQILTSGVTGISPTMLLLLWMPWSCRVAKLPLQMH